MKFTPWDANTKIQVLQIAATDGTTAASNKTGVPLQTVRYWVSAFRKGHPEIWANRQDLVDAQDILADVRLKVAEATTRSVLSLVEKLERTVNNAVDEMERVICQGRKVSVADYPAWLRSLAVAFKELRETHSLLTGAPSSRLAVEGGLDHKYVYDITQRILSDPETRGQARDLFRSVTRQEGLN